MLTLFKMLQCIAVHLQHMSQQSDMPILPKNLFISLCYLFFLLKATYTTDLTINYFLLQFEIRRSFAVFICFQNRLVPICQM